MQNKQQKANFFNFDKGPRNQHITGSSHKKKFK